MADTSPDLFYCELDFWIVIASEFFGAIDKPPDVETSGEVGPVRDWMFEDTLMDSDVAVFAAWACRSTDTDHRRE